MKRVLSLLALGLLAGCATYPDYGYYDDGRSYDGYASDDYYEDRYRDGGDYYYSTRPDYTYDDGFYGYGPYGHGYGGYSGYGGYGYGYGLGGYGGSLGYGFGHRPRIGLGFGFSSGGYYPYGGYYGGYPYGYSGFNNYYAPRRPYHYDRYDDRNENRWRDARGRYGGRGDGVTHDDASDLASEIARQRGARDSTARSRSSESYARDRDPALDARNGWRSDYRDAQLASPRGAAAGNAYSRESSAPQLRMEQAPAREWRGQSQERQQNTARFESAPRQSYAAPRFESAPRQQGYAAPRFESAPQRFSQPAAAPRYESREESTSPRSSSREREATDEP